MKKMKFVLGVKCVCIISLMLLACSVSKAAEKKPVLAFIPGSFSNQSQAYAAKMFEKYGDDYGFEIKILESPDGIIQADNVLKSIELGVDVIAVNPNDIVTIIPSLKKAKEAGIVVCMFSSDLPKKVAEIRDVFCGVDDTMAGEVAAKAFISKFPGGANIVEIGGQEGHDAQVKRYQGFNSIIEGSNIEVLATQNCAAWSTDDAKKVMEDLILAFGDEIQGVFCHWDNGVTGIIQALEDADMEDVYIVGVDGCKKGFEQVRSGKQSITIAQNIGNIAKKTMDSAQQILGGGKVETVNFIPLDTIGSANINDYETPEW